MADYRLYCLGRPFLELDGKPVKLEMRKSLALLIYLRMAECDHSRESLATLFWPEHDQNHALANLRRALSSLNKSIHGELLDADREKISLKDQQIVWLDVEEFQKRLSISGDHPHVNEQVCSECLLSLEEAIRLYRGDFLEGFILGDCAEFEEWHRLQNESLRQEYARALQKIAEGYAARSAWEQAISCARKWVALDQLNEQAQRFLISLYEQAGMRSASLSQYNALARLLMDELGQEPEPETSALNQRILRKPAATTKDRAREFPNGLSGPQSSEPLLKTKLYIPASRGQKVHRQHLVHQLNQIEQYPLVVLSAPAGFGKTTSLVEWISQTSLPVAWYSLDSDDNQIGRFLQYFVAGLESIQGGAYLDVTSLLKAPRSASPQLVLTHLIHELEKAQTPLVFVLDDYQFITSQAIHDAVAYLLDHLPAGIHIVIATRADPPLRLARLRSRGQVLEIRTNDLRFSEKEAFEYLTCIYGLPLMPSDIALLDKKVEGWIAGLQMAALSMREHEDLHRFVEDFSGTNRYILDYLLEEVLASQPPEIQRFLLHTSILERLTGSLCDAVLAEEKQPKEKGAVGSLGSAPLSLDRSASILERLERANLFLSPLDDERIWYRYHHLFADLLRTRLQRSLSPQDVAQNHIRAAEWHAQNGSILEAINHASAAGDDERVERFIEQNYMELVSRGEQSWMRYWTGKLSKEQVYRRPWLCIYEAYSHSWFGELDEADQFIEAAEKCMSSEQTSPEARSMHGLLSYVKSRVTAMRGDLHHAIEYCLAARELVPANNLALRLDACITLGYEYFMNGDYVNAGLILNETIRLGVTIGAVINTVAASCILARLNAIQGLLHKPYEIYQKAAQFIPHESGEHRGSRALVDIGISELLYEWNDLDGAMDHMQQGLSMLHFWGKADDFVLAYITLARIRLARAHKSEAVEQIEKAIHLIQTTGVFSEARHTAEVAQVRLWLALGDTGKAAEWLKQHQVSHRIIPEVWVETEEIASIRVLMALGKYADALDLAARLTTSAEAGERGRHLIESLILQSLALQATGKPTKALRILCKALALSQPEGYTRIYLDEGQSMLRLLLRGSEQGIWDTHPLKEYVSLLLQAFEGEKFNG